MGAKTLLALSALVLAGTTVPAAAQEDVPEVVVEAPRQVTGNPNPVRLFDIPALAVHPDDPQTVVMAVGDARSGGCGLRVSRDGGLSWTQTAELMPDDLPFCYQRPLFPVMDPVFAPDGTLHVAMPGSSPETGHPNGPIHMLAARTEDLGQTHQTVTVAEAGLVTVDPADYRQEGEPVEAFTWHKSPSLAVDPNDPDRLYLAMRWNAWGTDLQPLEAEVPFRPYIAISEDGGQTWGEPIDIVRDARGEQVYGALSHELVIAPDGTIYSFSREWPAPVPEGAPEPKRRMLMFTSTDGGRSWEITPILEDVEDFSAPYPEVDPRSGNLYLVYGGESPGAEGDGEASEEVYFTVSEDGGASWSEPVQISDDTSSASERCPEGSESPSCLPTAARLSDSLTPGIDVAPNGRIDVAWYDFRNDPFSQAVSSQGHAVENRYWDVYYGHSSDGGASWSPNIRVTKTTVDGAEGATFNNMDVRGPIGIASTDEIVHLAWADSRPSGDDSDAEDAYLSRIRFPGTEALGAGDDQQWAWGIVGAGVALGVAGLALFVVVRASRRSGRPAGGEVPA